MKKLLSVLICLGLVFSFVPVQLLAADDTTDVTVTIKWDDNNDEKGIRPDSIDVCYGDGAGEEAEYLTLSSENSWKGTIEDVTVSSAYDLYLTEDEDDDPAPGYTYEITGDPVNGYTITFSLVDLTATTTIKGKIVWEDDDNKKKIRPTAVEIRLWREDMSKLYSSYTVTSADDWTYEFKNLPKYNDYGHETYYSVSATFPSWYSWQEESTNEEFILKLKDDNSLGVYVLGNAVTKDNAGDILGNGSVKYDDKTKTLTINDMTTGETQDDYLPCIETYNDIIICVKGENFLGHEPVDNAVLLKNKKYSNVITTYGLSNITLKGDGDLNIYCKYNGIVAKNVTIDMTGKLKIMEYGAPHFCAIKADGGTITIKNGIIDLYSHIAYCLYADKIDIQGGYIHLHSDAGKISNVKPTLADDLRVSVGNSEDMLAAGSAEDLLKSKCAKIATSDPQKSPKPEGTLQTNNDPKTGNVPQTGEYSAMNAAVIGILCFDLAVFFVLMMVRKKVEL